MRTTKNNKIIRVECSRNIAYEKYIENTRKRNKKGQNYSSALGDNSMREDN